MRIIPYDEKMLDECTQLWWELYGGKPYVVRPDGYFHPNAPSIGPEVFREQIMGFFASPPIMATPESILLAQDNDGVAGIMVCTVDCEKGIGSLHSAFMHRDERGQEAACLLVKASLEHFQQLHLRKAEVGPSGSLEVDCPIHIPVVQAGFTWDDNWEEADEDADGVWRASCKVYPRYLFYLGGSLEGFQLQHDIKERMSTLLQQGITFQFVEEDEVESLRRYDTHQSPSTWLFDEVRLVALVEGRLVGWFEGVHCHQTAEIIARCDAPYVIPAYRRRGIGKVLYHLMIEKLVQGGAQYGFGFAPIHSPFRLILQSVGFAYWYLGFGWMSLTLQQ